MCGIAGIIAFNPSSVEPSSIALITDTLRHRGPDDEGFVFINDDDISTAGGNGTPAAVWESSYSYSPQKNIQEIDKPSKVALGHRRLSIIDTTPAGHQPMCTLDKKYWIVHNGEIYNYIELREELSQKAYSFVTNTDTEVVLYAYMEWGTDCVKHFNGMWAFVIYDSSNNTLWGSRDITGVKPFYYYYDNNVFVFASEQKALLQLPFIKREINPAAAFDFLVFNKIESEQEGMFKGIMELPPSHSFRLDISTNKFNKTQYYSPNINHDKHSFSAKSYEEYSQHIQQLFTQAVSLRLRSDVPVGSCLSGGIDSSSIVCTINQLLQKENLCQLGIKQKVFTTSFAEAKYNESPWAKIIAEHTGAEWLQTFPKKEELLHDLEDLIYCQDVPIRSTSTYAQYRVMKLAAENGIKVVLDGQGGDELFSGYYQHYYASLMGSPSRLQTILKHSNIQQPFSYLIKYFVKHHLKQLPTALRYRADQHFFQELQYLHPDFLHAHYKDAYRRDTQTNVSSLNKLLGQEYYQYGLKELLKCEDRCSMRFSIESRTPFADDIHLMNYLFSIPSNYKIVDGTTKALLRNAMKDILPEKVRMRKDKMGFVTPNNQWIAEMKDELRPYFEQDTSGILNKALLLKDYDSFFAPTTTQENYRIFKFISFAVWWKVFMNNHSSY